MSVAPVLFLGRLAALLAILLAIDLCFSRHAESGRGLPNGAGAVVACRWGDGSLT